MTPKELVVLFTVMSAIASSFIGYIVYFMLKESGRTPPIPVLMGIMAGIIAFTLYTVWRIWYDKRKIKIKGE